MDNTSYKVMARRWRPETFGDVVSQEHITQTLQNAIRSDRIAHAYLFSGPRGTGKTTTARLLAKALNCENGPTPDPCGECVACCDIRDGRSLDVRVIDGASTGLVDDIRQLREEVPLSTTDNFLDCLDSIFGALAAFFRFLADSFNRLQNQVKEFARNLDVALPEWRTELGEGS